jgi:hypothetical protein
VAQDNQRAQSLSGRLVGLSAGDAQDVRAYGLLPRHLDLVFGAIVAALVIRGARLAYGGDLRQRGFTQQLYDGVAEAYADDYLLGRSATPPFVHYLSANIWTKVPSEKLEEWLTASAGLTEVRFMTGNSYIAVKAGEDKFLIKDHGEQDVASARDVLQLLHRSIGTETNPAQSLALMRRRMGKDCHARILLGGKMYDYSGDEPGVGAEARESLEHGSVVLPLGGFGGASNDVARQLGLREDVRRRETPVGPGYHEVMHEIAAQRTRLREQLGDRFGKARRLAVTTDIKEAAHLVVDILEALPRIEFLQQR